MKQDKKIIAVVSGGMDSVTMLYKLANEFKEVEVISFIYGQRHIRELKEAEFNAEKLGLKHTIIPISFLGEISKDSSLTSDNEVPEGHYEAENMKSTVVPGRNLVLASIALSYAYNAKADYVALGAHSGDHEIYPDCRPEFYEALNEVAKIADYQPVELYFPFIDGDKTSIIKEGLELGVDYARTWTCYKGLDKACGKCGSCQERLEAFRNNNLEDPLEYDTREAIAKV